MYTSVVNKVNTFLGLIVGSLSLSVWTLGRISEKVARDESMCLHSDLGLSKGSSCQYKYCSLGKYRTTIISKWFLWAFMPYFNKFL